MRSSLIVLAALLFWVGRADAGRKRIVVLDFEGPKAEKFHSDVVKLIKKGHTVLTVDKWNEAADEMGATSVTDKNIKKLAKKLKIDGVVTGKVEKRRDEYILRLKLRSGATGEVSGNPVQTKADGASLDAQAKRDIKDELIAAIDELESNRSGGDDEEEEVAEEEDGGSKKKSGFGKKGQMSGDEEEEEEEDPKAAKKRKAEEEKQKKADEEEAKRLAKEEEKKKKDDEKKKKADEEEAKRLAKEDEKKKKKADEEAALATKAAMKREKDEEEADEEESSKKRASSEDEEDEEDEDGVRKAKKRKASRDEDEESVEDSSDSGSSGDRDLSPAGRALDAVVGMSFVARTLKFTYAADLGKPPPGYKQSIPVAGAIVDVTLYPLAFGKSKGIIRGIGLNVLYDQVIVINSQKRYADQAGVQQIANLKTSENRWLVGAVLRYPMGKVVLGGSLSYGKQQFTVAQTLPNMEPTDIPSVAYTMITPAAFVKYPVTPKITLNGDLAFHAVTNTGQIQSTGMTGYGAATVTAFELEAGGDYMIKKNIFARASLRYESFGIKFKGDPTSQSNLRDTDPEQDVTAAKDTYLGGTVTVGYVY